MARKVQRKGKIQENFPKLAFWNGPEFTISFPESARGWSYKRRILNPSELIVVVAQRGIRRVYMDRIGGGYYYGDGQSEILINHIIPVEAIGKGEIPITCIYNWVQSYKSLPHFLTKYIKIIEGSNGEVITQAATAI